MKEITRHSELVELHGREVIVDYKERLVEGVLSVNSDNMVYFCFDGLGRNRSIKCEESFGHSRSRLVSHPSFSSRYEIKESRTKHIFLKEEDILKSKSHQDTLDKIIHFYKEIDSLREEIEADREKEISKAIKRSKIQKLYLCTNENKTMLKMRYKDTTLVQTNNNGLITYRKREEALKLFKEWVEGGELLEACTDSNILRMPHNNRPAVHY
jgi:hypothetical protein